jgi:hypothetical protein
MIVLGGRGIRHGRPYHPSSVRVGTVTVGYVTVDGWGVRVMGIHGIRGISKGYSGGLDSLVLYFDKNTII